MSSVIFAAVVAVLLATVACYYYIKARRLTDYKELFELGDSEYKKANERIQDLVAELGNKNVLMERGATALDVANVKMQQQDAVIKALDEKLRFSEAQYEKLLGQKKSSEVRTGKIAEQISPFLSDYPLDPQTARFIGDPIDFVHFDEEQVTFVEVKAGRSQLSKKQRKIRDLIKEGKVDFQIYRISGDKNGTD